MENGLNLVDKLFQIVDREYDDALELQAHHAAWGTRCWFGDMEVAIKHVERGLELYEREKYRDHASRYGGHDPGVCAHAQGALTFWYRGYPDDALQRAKHGIEFAHELNHPPSIGHAQLWLCNLLFQRRDKDQLSKAAAQLTAIASEHALGQYQDQATLFSTWANTHQIGAEAAIEVYKSGLLRSKTLGQKGLDVFRHYMLAETSLAVGNPEQADKHVNSAIDLIAAPEPHVLTADLYRLKSAIECADPDYNHAAAYNYLQQAMVVARSQNAKSLELRVAIDLARLYLRQNDVSAAREALYPIHDWFTEGFETIDWLAAKDLRAKIETNS
ncbi:MAG: hypothetical protein GKR97_00780 [Rhizobiaceae bacterium]|nr:hypothetical protein [Rhizobiaceae bacterium]